MIPPPGLRPYGLCCCCMSALSIPSGGGEIRFDEFDAASMLVVDADNQVQDLTIEAAGMLDDLRTNDVARRVGARKSVV